MLSVAIDMSVHDLFSACLLWLHERPLGIEIAYVSTFTATNLRSNWSLSAPGVVHPTP